MLKARMAEPPRRRGLAVGVAFACLVTSVSALEATRLVAIGDVHGDIEALQQTLVAAGVLDQAGEWLAGDTHVIQVGDLLDRGPQLRGALEFVMSLEERAPAAGGRFTQMLGNHEVMNLLGDLRYVTAENFAEFTDDRSESRREQAWKEYRDWQRRRAERLDLPKPSLGSAAKREWLATHPLGLVEHREAFAPDGRYGRWLRDRPSLVRVGDVLFVHGGLSPARRGESIESIDGRVHDEIARFDRLRARLIELDLALPAFDLVEIILAMREERDVLDRRAANGEPLDAADAERRELADAVLAWDTWSIYSSDGPLWFRGFSRWSDEEAATEAPALLSAFGVRHIVVGHTPQEGGRMRARADGALLLIDAGMNGAYVPGGRRAALEIVDGVVTAIYPGEPSVTLWRPEEAAATDPAGAPAEAVPDEPGSAAATTGSRRWLGPDGEPLPFADDDELLEFLRTAEIVADEPIGEGITRPHRLTLERGGVRARATFRSVEEKRRIADLGRGRREMNFRDYYGFEPAAYRLGRLLGVDNIPPATMRRVKGKGGSLQIWVEKAMTEGRRLEAGTQPPNSVRWLRQLQMMRLWDDLVGNTDRNQGNILFDSDWQLWMIDHTRAFRHSVDLRQAERTTWCERGFYDQVRSVGDDEIREALREFLAPGEIRGILERRAKIVDVLEALVAERGEGAVLFRWTD